MSGCWLSLSDLHGELPVLDAWLAGVDGVLLAGDLAPDTGNPHDPADQAEWFDTVFHDWARALAVPVHACYGNHDFAEARRKPDNLHIGGDTLFGNVFVFGWSLNFGPWNWMCDEKNMAERLGRYDRLPPIWVMHSPPYRCCEFGPGRRHAGAKAIRRAI